MNIKTIVKPMTQPENPQVLIGQSYYLRFDPKLWRSMQPYPPLGSLYAASYLRQLGFSIGFFDAMLAESEEDWRDALKVNQPKYAVIFEDNFNYLSKMCLLRMRQAAFSMCRMARTEGCTVILCGSDATDHPELYFAEGADFILAGEGEITLGELLRHLTGQSGLRTEQIESLIYSGRDNELRRNPVRRVLKDLDLLPFPAWDLIDIQRYKSIWQKRHGYFSMNMVTTRGCPYHCNWCAKPIWGQRYHSRSPQNVVEELIWLKNAYQPDHIWFADDIFGLKPGWIDEFANLVVEYGVRVPFKSLNRADLLLKSDTAGALKRAGCQICWIGAESGSQKILDAMEKGTTIEQIRIAARNLQNAGIKVGFFLQFGYPGETWNDIEKTMDMVRDCRPDDIGISVSYPLPGTRFYERVKEQLGEKQNWDDSDDLAMLYEGPFSTEFYRKLHRVIHKEFRRRNSIDRISNTHLSQLLQIKDNIRHIGRILVHSITLPIEQQRLTRLARDLSMNDPISG